jgi:hypothetical protein
MQTRPFDRNGVLVAPSAPTAQLRTVKKVITIDSRDRDPTKYVKVNGGATSSDPGDFVVYLPRVYENVVSIRLKSAIIRAPESTNFTDNYILMSIEGLDKIDETATGAQRSGLVDNAFAKISNPNFTKAATGVDLTIFYNDKSDEENITRYTPPIGRLDRFHITLRYHPSAVVPTVTTNNPATNPNFAPITFGTSNNSFTFEIEMLDNGFTDFSSFETRLRG